MIISLHLPKAGGSSMLALLKQTFGENNVLVDLDDPTDPNAEYIKNPSKWISYCNDLNIDAPIVHGHFRPEKYLKFEKAFRLTFIRHPVINMKSIFRYWSLNSEYPTSFWHDHFLRNRLNLTELASLPPMRHLYSQTYFGNFDINKMDFIGIHEFRELSMKKLSSKLNKNFHNDFHENRTPQKADDLNFDQFDEDLENILSADIKFYDRCVKLAMKNHWL